MNRIFLCGNLGADPELKYTASGTAVARFRLATSERRKVGDELKEETTWHTVVCAGKYAENCAQYLAKGSKVLLEGKLQEKRWETPQGEKRTAIEVFANHVQFLGSPRRDGLQASEPSGLELLDKLPQMRLDEDDTPF